ncbi:MAG: 2-amino-4-hydroxy-6-hydroxymethyldihydropteridine diphosphokinase [Prevotella sp.]
MEKKRLIIAIGSNYEQEINMNKASTMLKMLFSGNICFTKNIWTDPIGIKSDRFLNCIAMTYSCLTPEEICDKLKTIESSCGSNEKERRQNIVRMDIDILMYGTEKYHTKDWERLYIKELIKELKKYVYD